MLGVVIPEVYSRMACWELQSSRERLQVKLKLVVSLTIALLGMLRVVVSLSIALQGMLIFIGAPYRGGCDGSYMSPSIEKSMLGVVVPPGRCSLSQYTGNDLCLKEEIRLAVGGATPVSGRRGKDSYRIEGAWRGHPL